MADQGGAELDQETEALKEVAAQVEQERSQGPSVFETPKEHQWADEDSEDDDEPEEVAGADEFPTRPPVA